jgi:hypothetical protein
MKLREISEPYASNLQTYQTEKERIEKQIERLNRKKDRLIYPSWIDQLIKPIAEFILPLLPGYDKYEILGPFGLCNEIGIHFIAEGTSYGNRNNSGSGEEYWDKLKSITFTPGDLDKGELMYRNYNIDTGMFGKGSIGEMNGMNHPDTVIDANSDLRELLEIINRKEKVTV